MLHDPAVRAVPHASTGRQREPAAPTLPVGAAGLPLAISGLPVSGAKTSRPLEEHAASELSAGSVPGAISLLSSLIGQAETSLIRLKPFDFSPLLATQQSGPDGEAPATVLFAITVFAIETLGGKSSQMPPPCVGWWPDPTVPTQ